MLFEKCKVFEPDYVKYDGQALNNKEIAYLRKFMAGFRYESEKELERKRDVFRNRILASNSLKNLGGRAMVTDDGVLDPGNILREKIASERFHGFDKHGLDKEKFDILTFLIRKREFWKGWTPYIVAMVSFVLGIIATLLFKP